MLELVLGLLLIATPVAAAKPALCPGGDFRPDQPLVTRAGPVDAIVIEGSTLALGSSCSGPVKLKAKRKGTVVRGNLPCAAGGRARFKGLIAAGCQRLTGRLQVKKQRFKVAANGFVTPATTTTITPTSTSTTTTQPFSSPLVSRDWTVPGSTEAFKCRRVQVPADVYITGFRASAPAGTSQVLATVTDTLGAGELLGDYDCASGIAVGVRGVFASGLGTGDVVFPAGYGVHLRAGQYLNLQLHLVNPDVSEASGSAGVFLQTGTAADVTHEVELVFAGTFGINLPPGGGERTETGGCTAPAGFQIVGLWPHMHALGVHARLNVVHNGLTQVLLDSPFAVDAQQFHAVNAAVQAGDQIQSSCTYVNSTGATVRFGESSSDEQCLIGLYRSPLIGAGDLYGCVSF